MPDEGERPSLSRRETVAVRSHKLGRAGKLSVPLAARRFACYCGGCGGTAREKSLSEPALHSSSTAHSTFISTTLEQATSWSAGQRPCLEREHGASGGGFEQTLLVLHHRHPSSTADPRYPIGTSQYTRYKHLIYVYHLSIEGGRPTGDRLQAPVPRTHTRDSLVCHHVTDMHGLARCHLTLLWCKPVLLPRPFVQ